MYNGWTNYETWFVKRWLDNDGLDEMMLEFAREGKDLTSVADQIKEYVGTTLEKVDWYEIARAYIDEVEEEPLTCDYCGEEVDGELTDKFGDPICEKCSAIYPPNIE